MARLLDLLWRLLSILGLVLSLRRWWRTLSDPEERRETRILAGVVLLCTLALVIWSIISLQADRHQQTALLPTAQVPAGAPPRLVVDFRDDLSLADIARRGEALGLRFEPNSPVSVPERLMIADAAGLSAAQRSATLARLRADEQVEAADEDSYLTLLGQAGVAMEPNDPRYGEQWSFRAIGMPQAWEQTRGAGAVVAVIDTGVAFEAENGVPAASDLKQTRWTKPYDFTRKKAKAYDDHGHGTHVAGTIAQSTNNRHGVAGIAYEATIMPLKVLSSSGSGTMADIADAINYAADNGANVINMSLGGPRGAAVLARAIKHANERGVVIVCAAGNTGGEGVCYPAAYPECIAVSAVGPSGELTFYSTWGKEIAIAAPGGEYRKPEEKANGILQNTVFMKKDTFESWQGTSMASPHVAGVAALLVSQGIKEPDAVRRRLAETATPKDDPLRYGAGLLNAARAVGASGPARFEPQPVVARPVHRGGWLVLVGSSVLWPLSAVLLLLGVKPLRPLLSLGAGAFAVGCFAACWLGLGPVLWLVANGLAAVGLCHLVRTAGR